MPSRKPTSGKLRDVFQDISFNSNKLGDEKQKNDILQSAAGGLRRAASSNLRPAGSGKLDIIGNAYEYLIGKFAASAGKKAGEFYTPPEVSRADRRAGRAAGGRRDLRSRLRLGLAADQMRRQIRKLRLEELRAVRPGGHRQHLGAGQDEHVPARRWTTTASSGATPSATPSCSTRRPAEEFEVVVANPPFSLDKWGHEGAEHDHYSRFRRGVPPKTKGDYAFILHMIETLKPTTGRMGVVVPHGVLFRGSQRRQDPQAADRGEPARCRDRPAGEAVLRHRHSRRDPGVPQGEGGRQRCCSSTPAASTRPARTRTTCATPTSQDRRDLQARQTWTSTPTSPRFEEIEENDYNLNIPRYVDTFEEEEEIDLMAVREERKKLKAELAALEQEMEGYLKELGYVS